MELKPSSFHIRPIDKAFEAGPDLGLLERVFAARGVRESEELDRKLGHLLSPDLLDDINLAAERLVSAILADELVLIVGDYDADGATATVLAVSLLQALGCKRVDFLVPDRFEFGYGLSEEIVTLAANRNPDVIVTVDNGISSAPGVEAANVLGIDVIITDHHLPSKNLPAAAAIVNPNKHQCGFPSKNLAGVGVVFYLLGKVRGLLEKKDWFKSRQRPNIADWLDLVALGTIADVVTLDRNNRILVDQGLRRIRAGRTRPGIKALCEVSGKDLASIKGSDLGFSLGPRLNAAGRLDDMTIGIKCLLEEDLELANKYAKQLDKLNKSRREIESAMVKDAELILAGLNDVEIDQNGICIFDSGWHQGVVGILAGRLKDRFYRPVIAFAPAGSGSPGELKGSARSIPNFHIRDTLDAIAARYPGMISKFGGHAMAAGITLKRINYERFAKAFDDQVRTTILPELLEQKVYTDGELDLHELKLENAKKIASAGPWGQGFPEPIFEGTFHLVSQRIVGEDHLKIVVRKDDLLIDGIAFRQKPIPDAESVRLIYRLEENDYRGSQTLQLIVEHILTLQ